MNRITLIGALLALLAGVAIAQNVSNYKEQGGARTVIGGSLDVVSGGDLDIESGGALKIAGTAISSSAAELNIMNGVTASAAELSTLTGITSTVSDLNARVFQEVIFCGQADESGIVYLGPATAAFGGDGSDASIAGTACDALDSGVEATADAPLYTDIAFQIVGVVCQTNGTLGSGETVIFTTRSAAALTTPSQTCTISEAGADCRILTATTTDIAAGATVAIKAVQSGDNADDDLWCKATIAIQ